MNLLCHLIVNVNVHLYSAVLLHVDSQMLIVLDEDNGEGEGMRGGNCG